MRKKLVLTVIAMLSAIALPVRALSQDKITMLVLPEEKIPLQVGQDISRRYPVLLVSYRLVKGELRLYAWNDEQWVAIPLEDYISGTFFANRPQSTIIVEHERFRAPDELIPNKIWCENAFRLTSTDPRIMLHLLGLHFDFPYRHWNQLAKRYGYALEDINPTLENVHWWNLRVDSLLEKRAKRDFVVDMNKWSAVEPLPPPPIKPVAIEKSPVIKEIEVPASGDGKITVKAPEKPAVREPDIKPVAATPLPAIKPAITPAPVVTIAPVAKPIPEVKTAPKAAPAIIPAPIPAAEPEPAPLIEAPVAQKTEIKEVTEVVAPTAKPIATMDDNPFSTGETPAAEIVVPQEPKKPWWRF